MSRIVEHNEMFTGIPASYDTVNSTVDGTSYVERAYKSAEDTSSQYATFTPSENGTYYAYYLFQEYVFPLNSTINNINCVVKARDYSQGGRGHGSVSLCNGTNEKGTPTTLTQTVTSHTLNVGSWTASELNNVKLRLNLNRLKSGHYIRFYGATLTVDYTWYETFYSISTSSNVQGVSISSTSGETLEGGSNTITLSNVSDISSIIVTDNGNDITSLFTRSGSNYAYTLYNINADHTIVVEDNASKPMYVNNNGQMNLVNSIHMKSNGIWQMINLVDFWRKRDGIYVNNMYVSWLTQILHGKI